MTSLQRTATPAQAKLEWP